MIGKQDRQQDELFIYCPLKDLVPDDHILKRVDTVLDLSWFRQEVEDCYCTDNGRPGIDPEAAIRLMLAGFFQGIVHDRKLIREAHVNLAIRWFAGFKLNDKLPHHSSLTRLRQRWGADRFKKVFLNIVTACIDAGLVNGNTVHIDATLIRADVSWESLTEDHTDKVIEENDDSDDGPDTDPPRRPGRPRKRPKKTKKRSKTDPDATMTTSRNDHRMEPSYKQHTAVDDDNGVIVDVDVTTGEASESIELPETLERIKHNIGRTPERLTADGSYASSDNYDLLEQQDIDAIIPPQSTARKPKRMPMRRLKYDAKHNIVKCPGGKILRRSSRQKNGWLYRAKASDYKSCPLCHRCISSKASSRTILIVDGYEALLRARRRRLHWQEEHHWYTRHRWRVEGAHGEAKCQHGLRRAVRRGIGNVAIQVYLTAAVMNLKRLAKALVPSLSPSTGPSSSISSAFLLIFKLLKRLDNLLLLSKSVKTTRQSLLPLFDSADLHQNMPLRAA
jgi:transposase